MPVVIGQLVDVMLFVLMVGLSLAVLVGVLVFVETIVERRDAQRRAQEEAAEAVFRAMAAGSRLRQQAWTTRRAMRNLDDDVIDVQVDDEN